MYDAVKRTRGVTRGLHTPVIVGISTIGNRRVDYAPIGERGEAEARLIHLVVVGGGGNRRRCGCGHQGLPQALGATH